MSSWRRFNTVLLTIALASWSARPEARANETQPTWTSISPAGAPPSARDGICPVFDPLRDRMIVYGGGGAWVDTWALDLSATPAWSILSPAQEAPTGRAYYSAVFDWRRDRMILFGGNSSGGVRLNDVWELSFAGGPAWSPIAATGAPPAARASAAAIFDHARDRMIVFGGATTSSLLNDVWALDLSGPPSWTRLLPTGTPPAARSYASAIFDPLGDRMVVFAGTGRNDVWSLSLSGTPAWAPVLPSGALPHGRFGQSAFFHPGRTSMIVFGGGFPAIPSYLVYNDTWELNLVGSPAWTEFAPSGSLPSGRLNHGAVYDPAFDRMIVFAGETQGSTFANDTWALAWGSPPVSVDDPALAGTRLLPPSPNPSSGSVRLAVVLAREAEVRVTLCDLQGRARARIEAGRLGPGVHTRAWEAIDDHGHRLASGMYLVRLEAEGRSWIRRWVLTR